MIQPALVAYSKPLIRFFRSIAEPIAHELQSRQLCSIRLDYHTNPSTYALNPSPVVITIFANVQATTRLAILFYPEHILCLVVDTYAELPPELHGKAYRVDYCDPNMLELIIEWVRQFQDFPFL